MVLFKFLEWSWKLFGVIRVGRGVLGSILFKRGLKRREFAKEVFEEKRIGLLLFFVVFCVSIN